MQRTLRLSISRNFRTFSTAAPRECSLEYLGGSDTGIAVLNLNRPATKNALGKTMLAQFQENLAICRSNRDIRVLVLRSQVDGVFCAGADLKERSQMTQEETGNFVYGLRSSFNELENLPMPTITAIEGAAFGGGLEMALATDVRIAGKSAKLGLTETGLAIIPGAGGTQRLPRLIGASKAKELIFTARRLTAQQALEYGIVNHLTEAGQAFDRALQLAREILPNGPVALRVAKIAVDQGMQVDRNTGFIIEQQCYAQIIPTKDRIEGLTAFKEKRAPVYRGE